MRSNGHAVGQDHGHGEDDNAASISGGTTQGYRGATTQYVTIRSLFSPWLHVLGRANTPISRGSPRFQVGNVPSNDDDGDVFSGGGVSLAPAVSPVTASTAFQNQLPPYITGQSGNGGQQVAAAGHAPAYGVGYQTGPAYQADTAYQADPGYKADPGYQGAGHQDAGHQGSGYRNGDDYQTGGYSRDREGNRRDKVGDVDAQAWYPATACVFVAK